MGLDRGAANGVDRVIEAPKGLGMRHGFGSETRSESDDEGFEKRTSRSRYAPPAVGIWGNDVGRCA